MKLFKWQFSKKPPSQPIRLWANQFWVIEGIKEAGLIKGNLIRNNYEQYTYEQVEHSANGYYPVDFLGLFSYWLKNRAPNEVPPYSEDQRSKSRRFNDSSETEKRLVDDRRAADAAPPHAQDLRFQSRRFGEDTRLDERSSTERRK